MINIHVILPTKNRPKLLERSLSSVIKQSFKPKFIIIVNDSDNEMIELTTDVVNNLKKNLIDTKLVEIRNNKTRSLSGSINSGLETLNSIETTERDFVALLDDDDWWDDKYLESCMNSICNNANWIIPGLIRYDQNNKNGLKQKIPNESEMNIDTFLIGNPNIQGSNMFIRLDLFNRIGGFDEELISSTDRDMCIRLLQEPDTRYSFLNEHLVHHWAFDEIPRLSSPGTKNKENGLRLFYQKYKHLMNSEIETEFKLRALNLFKINLS
ncbi:MAG: glycosyltransferase family 2 protein [Candidatus Heimdallarchaeota archaeon]|nr:glycosyltransferase family 2 protein [Candidatus Heimdallarchaeota archaeon]